ncbi:MAG: hypothetical protein A2268_13120 [Candidatus Raymondbacteria bacterium RifOxyA12_full_50_37]|uniref:Uncharacterized protein n=1 Tax=Candidatus Raymondbacteria bacterium RIFOXYD12_FULL_49_13 TaxID=1817890 RepID=A0A1F7EZW1_UNCRA|nr:MAG: hypothetical protein A2268_13120 [Candidatus Raymondbacteria bacterium RifOxyA12_full_50_37]OGJ93004.1 MAG: hypothetical protein A2248_18255 [Candidatus Raymondbacteria bacterium RIFOXYA2_FULL_49_16]OGJ93604.1 MAG: hypothetical protein A2350_19170 [Candidatus Raymondbacteria bacterium RifOxyB12_full_50_8]OGJ99917.1 MAG: hypothetical protein A2519_00235 [Candidatus Raymondbacteria bacterium RIFOXYD12_FULL_49_13]OGK01573.1 MAG: hypothetical protein A2487_15645 [Candidatus Raymondbacteria 
MLFSIITLVTNPGVYAGFKQSLLADIHNTTVIEFIPVDNSDNRYSAAQGLNKGLEQATGTYVMFCHQDILCKNQWLDQVQKRIALVEQYDPLWGVIGMAGEYCTVRGSQISFNPAGAVNDFLKTDGSPYRPAQVVDELCLIIRKASGLAFDPATFTHFHFYGADLCLSALSSNMRNYVILVPTIHLSDGGSNIALHYPTYRDEAKKLYRKWSDAFPCFGTTTAWFLNGRIIYLIGTRDNLEPAEERVPCAAPACAPAVQETRMDLSVILADTGSCADLRPVIHTWTQQPPQAATFEIIIVSPNADRIKSLVMPNTGGPGLKTIVSTVAGVGALLNAGIEHASGDILLFSSTQVWPSPGLVATHLQAHLAHNSPTTAICGQVAPESSATVSALNEYIFEACREFPFFTRDQTTPAYLQCTSMNLSIKRDFLSSTRFNEGFLFTSFEGAELGFRLMAKGLHLLYEKQAATTLPVIGTIADVAGEMARIGTMAFLCNSLCPNTINFGELLTQNEFTPHFFEEKIRIAFGKNIPWLEYQYARTRDPRVKKALFDLYDTIAYAHWCCGVLAAAGKPGKQCVEIKCSIIIVTFNNRGLTETCIESLVKNTAWQNYEIIIVDNNSTDGTREYLHTIAGFVRVHDNQANEGFAKACNTGASLATGPILLFLNNDTEISDPAWLDALMEEFADQETAIAGPKLLFSNGTIQHAGVVFAINNFPYHLYQHFPAAYGPACLRREFQAVTGACLAIRAALFASCGGFDQGYVNGWEDIDLCLRIRALGKKVLYSPKSVIVHHEGQSTGRNEHMANNQERFEKTWGNSELWDDYRYFVPDRALKKDDPAGLHIMLTHRITSPLPNLFNAVFQCFHTLQQKFRITVLVEGGNPIVEKFARAHNPGMAVADFAPGNYCSVFRTCAISSAAALVLHFETGIIIHGPLPELFNAAAQMPGAIIEVPGIKKMGAGSLGPVESIGSTTFVFAKKVLEENSACSGAYPEGFLAMLNRLPGQKLRANSHSTAIVPR